MTGSTDGIFNVAILGAGLGGLGMAMRLRMEGEEDFVILEKGDRVGGTWRDNTYPGAACDVQSHLYWFSFDEQPDWSRMYPLQAEIHANIERLTDQHDIRRHIRFGQEITSLTWEDGSRTWRLRSADGGVVQARSVVVAWGQLNRPTFGGIPGVEDFQGDWFHSARWNHDVKLAGRRVASVGVGPSAAQYIPEIAKEAAHLKVFQRSPTYVVPRLDRPYTDEERARFRADPSLLAASRKAFYDEHETWYGAMRQGTETAKGFTDVARQHLEAQVPDPELRKKLWPDYPIGCKRIIISDDYYPALVRPNVELVTEGIQRVEAGGIRTTDGVLHEVDAIVYGTGFETKSFLGPVEISGRGGRSLRDAWQGVPHAYLGLSISGFPNFFMLYGPNTNLGHNSILAMLECQFDYVLQGLAASRRAGRALDVKPQVMAEYNAKLQDDLRDSSFAGQCNSWYKTADGRITNNWSGSVEDYKAVTARFEEGKHEVV